MKGNWIQCMHIDKDFLSLFLYLPLTWLLLCLLVISIKQSGKNACLNWPRQKQEKKRNETHKISFIVVNTLSEYKLYIYIRRISVALCIFWSMCIYESVWSVTRPIQHSHKRSASPKHVLMLFLSFSPKSGCQTTKCMVYSAMSACECVLILHLSIRPTKATACWVTHKMLYSSRCTCVRRSM